MKIRTLIVDDMALSRERTRRYLADETDVEIVGECSDGQTALESIVDLGPDLILLDVQMPGMTGLDLLEQIPPEQRPVAIFITAFDEFAVSAFAAHAVDYLLKPFDRERLSKALERARAHISAQPGAAANASESGPGRAPGHVERISVKSVGRTVFVAADTVDWIEAAGNYVCLHVGKESHLVRKTMNQIESQLDPRKFVRIHRSTLVRIETIHEIQPLFNGDRCVILHDGTKLTMSRSYRDKARSVLGAL